MAIQLSSLSKPTTRPIHATLVGEGGIGKTTAGSEFPNPVFIRTEDGTQSITHRDDISLFPVAKSSQEVLDAITVLATEDHDFKTLVLDSITQLNTLIEAEIVESDPKAKSVATAMGGYGAGYSAVADRHRQIRDWTSSLSDHKGMNVVYLAHAEVETLDLPDQDPYARYTIRMHKKSVSHYSDNVDLVAYLKLKTYTKGSDEKRKKAITDGSRIITCYPTPSHISKNRFGITEDIPFTPGTNPFAPFIPALNISPVNVKAA